MTSESLSKISRNFLSLLSGEVIARALGFIAIIYLARVLGPDGFGSINFSIALTMFFVVALNRGLEPYLARRVARNRKLAQKSVGQFFAVRIPLSIIVYLIFVLFVSITIPNDLSRNVAILFGLEIFIFALTIEWLYQALERMQIIGISRSARQLIYVVFILLIIDNPSQLIAVPIIRFVSGLVVVIIMIAVAISRFGFLIRKVKSAELSVMMKISIPMGFSFFMAEIYHSFGHIMLGFMKGETVVGIYSAAYRFVPLATLLPALLVYSIFPHFARLFKHDKQELTLNVGQYLRLMAVFSIFIGSFVAIYSNPIVSLVYGAEYTQSAMVLRLLAFVIILAIASLSLGHPLLAWDLQIVHMRIVSVGALCNLMLNILLVLPFGMTGAAVATMLSEFIVLVLFFRAFSSIVSITSGLGSTIIASAIGASFMLLPLLLRFAQSRPILSIGCGLAMMILGVIFVVRFFARDAVRNLMLMK